MKAKKTLLSLSALMFAVGSASSVANTKEEVDIYVSDKERERIAVQWVEPKSFTDVREANFSSGKFRRHVFNQLEKHLDKLAKDLPEGQKLSVEVTDLDLAGRIEPASMVGFGHGLNDIRVMRNIDIPRIKFSYSLLDESGNVLKSEEEVKLKNMNYMMDNTSIMSRSRPFAHEKRMLSSWFRKNLLSNKT